MNLMSIGSFCAAMYIMNKSRVKGPVDNVRALHGISDVEHLLNGDVLDIVQNNKYVDRITTNSFAHRSVIARTRNNLIYYNTIHFDINTHKDIFIQRYNQLLDYIKNLNNNPDNFLIYVLGCKDVKNPEQFFITLNSLSKYFNLNKLIIIGYKQQNKVTKNVFLPYIPENLNYIELDNVGLVWRKNTPSMIPEDYIEQIKIKPTQRKLVNNTNIENDKVILW